MKGKGDMSSQNTLLTPKNWRWGGAEKRPETRWGSSKVAIFRPKNYSAEFETRRNRREFLRNSVCFAEEKNLRIPFRTISCKRKTIPFQTIFNNETLEFLSEPFSEEKTSEFYSEPFSKEKKLGIPFRTIFGRENTWKSVPNHFCEQKTLKKRWLLLAVS